MSLKQIFCLLLFFGTAANAQPDLRVNENITWNCGFFNECQQGLTCKDADIRLSIGYQTNDGGLAEVWFPLSEDNPNSDASWGHLTQQDEDGLYNISGISQPTRNGESTFTISISPGGWTVMTTHTQVIGALSAISSYGECQKVGN